MPRYAKRSTKKGRKRAPKRFKRRGRKFAKTSYRGRVVKVAGALPLPNKFTVKHRYIEPAVVIDPTGLIPAVYTFRANSLFDPNFSGSGHQPMGFDNIMPFYNHYTVIGSKIKVTFQSFDTVASTPTVVGILLNGEQTPSLPSWDNLAEQGNLTYSIMSPLGSAATTFTPANMTSLTKGYSAHRYFGRRGIITEDDFRGTASTNPVEQAYFHIFVCPANNSTNNGSIQAIVEIEYIAVYTELKQLASS